MSKNKTYSEKLRDPKWQKKRLEIMERESFKCEDCGAESKTLNVHHGFYQKGKNPWEYESKTLHCLCEECHVKRQRLEKVIHETLAMFSTTKLSNYWDSGLVYVNWIMHIFNEKEDKNDPTKSKIKRLIQGLRS